MIVIWGSNSTGSSWLCRIVNDLLTLSGGGKTCALEPFAPGAHKERWFQRDWFTTLVAENFDLVGRWPGRNDKLSVEDVERVHLLLQAFIVDQPTAVGLKTLLFPYWGQMEDLWPDVKFLRITRALPSYLECVARRDVRWRWFLGRWWYPLEKDPPWEARAWAATTDYGGGAKYLPLFRAAYHRHVHYCWHDGQQTVGSNARSITFESLNAGDVHTLRDALSFCELPVDLVDNDQLRCWMAPRGKNWDYTPYTPADVNSILAFLKERNDCRFY